VSEPEDQEVMIAGFRGVRGGGATARFAPVEALLLRDLVAQVAALVGDGLPSQPDETTGDRSETAALERLVELSDNSKLPDDPILARLLPDAYRDDEAASGEFRRYTEHSLRAGKVAAAQTVLDTLPEGGGRVLLTEDQAQAWLRSLNDVRIALGTKLDVTEDRDQFLDLAEQGDEDAAALWIYDWLSLLQSTLVQAVS
jgi:Domain of unknown function (DUF2017)